MRIIGYLEYPGAKATVFKMDNRISVKFETGLYEQTYKFREGEGVDSLEEASLFFDEEFMAAIAQNFRQMHLQRNSRLTHLQKESISETDFEEII